MRLVRTTPGVLATVAALAAITACAGSTSTGSSKPSRATPTSVTSEAPNDPSASGSGTMSGSTSGGTSTPTTKTKVTPPPSEPPASTVEAPTSPAPDPDSSPKRARLAQIPASKLPGFHPAWKWTETAKLRDTTSPCLLTTLVAIGAVDEVGRRFTNSTSDTSEAVQLTGVFPDEHTALTATAVLTAWHDKCAENATEESGLKRVRVSDMRDVSTPVGTGRQWMVTYKPVPGHRNWGWFDAEGFVRDGDTITYLLLRNAGQDYNYETGQEPIDRALAVAGALLKRTRGS